MRMFSSKIGGGAIEMENASDWDTYLNSEFPIVLQAGAGWCRPCTVLKPMIANVAQQYEGKVQYVYMDIDKFQEIA